MKTETKIVARYAETDQMGIVHHSVYPVWYEVARTEFIKHAGMSYSEMEAMGIMLPLLECHCKYKLPAHYEDELTIRTSISQLTPVKIEFLYEVFREDGKCINIGHTLHAWTNCQLHPIRLNRSFPEVYGLVSKLFDEEQESPEGKGL